MQFIFGKKYLYIFLTLLLCLTFLFGCSRNSTNFEPNKFTLEDLSIYDTVSEKYISYGMTKDEVEKILGKSSQSSISNLYSYDSGKCIITYRDDKAVLISISSKEKLNNPRLISYRKVKVGDKCSEGIEKYGSATSSVSTVITYSLKKADSMLIKLEENEMKNIKTGSEETYLINFSKDKSDMIKSITIGDCKALVYFK